MNAILIRGAVFWLLVLLGLALLAGLVQLATPPIAIETDRVAAARTQLTELATRRVAVREAASRLPASAQGPDPRLDQEGSAADGLQRLQERARAALTAAGGTPVISQTGSEPAEDKITRLRLLVRAKMTEPALMEFLRDIESGMPRITVGSLEMHTEPTRQDDNLEITLTLIMLHADAL